jgi:hypothetical protein
VRRHWYKPGFWRWWWSTRSLDAKAPIVIAAVVLFGAGGYLAVAALPNTGSTSGREVVTMTRIVPGEVRIVTIRKVLYRTIADYATVTQRSRVATVAVRGKPVTTEITRNATVVTPPVTVNRRRLVTHVITHQQTVTVRQTVNAGGRTVTNESIVTQPVTQVSTTVFTSIVPVTTTVSVTTALPGSTVTRTVTVTTPGPTTTVVVFPSMTVTFPFGG